MVSFRFVLSRVCVFLYSLGLTRIFFLNHPKTALNHYRHFGVVYHRLCILSVYTLLKVVSYYDMSVQEKSFDGGWVGGWGDLYPIFFGFWEFFVNFAKPLTTESND